MGREPLTPGARYFISTHVRSVRQLEVLLLMRARRQEAWTAGHVAETLRIAPGWAARELDAMEATGLLASDGAEDPGYRYAATGSEDQAVTELEDAYRRRKSAVIQAILSAMGSDVHALSDAFRLRRDSDG